MIYITESLLVPLDVKMEIHIHSTGSQFNVNFK
jgi:hypothetical protein